jgi:hypothetical protein
MTGLAQICKHARINAGDDAHGTPGDGSCNDENAPHNLGVTPEEHAAEARSYIEATALDRGSPEYCAAIRDLLDLFQPGWVPTSIVKPADIGALGNDNPLGRHKAIDAALATGIVRYTRSELRTPVDLVLLYFIARHCDNEHGRCAEPSYRMAKFADVDERTVRRRLKKMVAVGILGQATLAGGTTRYWVIYDQAVVFGSAYDVLNAIAPRNATPVGRPPKVAVATKKGGHSETHLIAEMGGQSDAHRFAENVGHSDTRPLSEKGGHPTQKGWAPNAKTVGNQCPPATTLATTRASASVRQEAGYAVATQTTADVAEALRIRLLDVANGAIANPAASGLLVCSPIVAWIEAGADPERDIVPAVRAVAERVKQKSRQIASWEYFSKPVADWKARREAGLPAPSGPSIGRDCDNRSARGEEARRILAGITGRLK